MSHMSPSTYVSFRLRLICQLSTQAFGPKNGSPEFPGTLQVSLGRRILTTDVAIVSLTTLAADALAEPVRMAPAAKSPWSAWLVSKLC